MKITLTKATVYETEGVRLIAGENDLTGVDTATFMKNPLVKADIESGLLVVEKPAAKAAAKPAAKEQKAD
jgi:hypothetical protein